MDPVEIYMNATLSTELSMNCQYEKLTIFPLIGVPGKLRYTSEP